MIKTSSVFNGLDSEEGINILLKLNDNSYLYAIINDDEKLVMTKFNLIFNDDNSIEINSQHNYLGEEKVKNDFYLAFKLIII